jgi:hypothetical protein|tara:strand:+ start:2907 stop:3911 length:1005 start_codon:yes stop_codon:yes gene_type:complete
MSVVNDIVLTYLPPKRKTTPSGWTSFNAPCCHHNGESADTRQRGGLISNPDGGLSFHCFNCGFKCSWQPGRNLSHKMRKFLQWNSAPDDVINKLALQVMQENEGIAIKNKIAELPTFHTTPMPQSAKPIPEWADYCALEPGGVDKNLLAVIDYMKERSLYIDDFTFYWTPELGYRDRLIIPFMFEGRIVGWTARKIKNGNPKYLSEQQPGYVFNLDEQRQQKIFVIVCEGPIDAIHVEGVALLGSELKDQQAMLINRLGKDVIVVPDRDDAGSKLVEEAIQQGWQVSMPNWDQDVNDIGDAVNKYGKLFTLYNIVGCAENSALKIRLRAKRWFG